LKQNYPNPFNPETKIPFTIGDFPVCTDPSRRYTVSLTILNELAQLYAVPILQGQAGDGSGGRPLLKRRLACGEYIAHWNGKILNTSKEAASGIYAAVLDIDGRRLVIKMRVTK
jgi:hypothetical protein